MSAGNDMTEVPEEIASAVNLIAHPVAGAVALSALGIGMAGHAFGMWIGVFSGAAEASRRAFASFDADFAQERAETGVSPQARARTAADRLMAETQAVARKAAGKAVPAANPDTKSATVLKLFPSASPVVVSKTPVAADFRKPAPVERPETPDDLKSISGVGPKLEKVLNGLGVWTFAQIAAWSAGEVAWVEDYLAFSGRIGRDDWIGQARSLARTGS